MALVAIVTLSFRARTVWTHAREHKRELIVWGALAVVGLGSAFLGYDVAIGLSNWPIPFVFIWTYCLGRWGITDPEHFLRSMLRGTALLAAIMVIGRLLDLDIRVGDFPILTDFNAAHFGRGNVLGVVANGLAIVLEAGAVGGIGWLLAKPARRDKLEGLVIAGLCVAAVFITMSRGAMVGIAAGVVTGGLLFSPLALVPVAIAGLVAFVVSPRVRSIIDIRNDPSNVARLRIWEGTWRMLKDHLWLGVGPGNFGLVYPSYSVPEYEVYQTPHNTYLNLMTGWGIIGGLLFFGWIAWVVIRNFLRGLSPLQKVMIMILAAHWTHVLFDDLIAMYAALLLGTLENSATPSAHERGATA